MKDDEGMAEAGETGMKSVSNAKSGLVGEPLLKEKVSSLDAKSKSISQTKS
jgi:hypothetical protein